MSEQGWKQRVAALWSDPGIDDEERVSRMRALALHGAGRSAEALRVVIEAIEPTPPCYHRSVRADAEALTGG